MLSPATQPARFIDPLSDFGFKKLIELPKFTKAGEELETDLDRWLFLLKNLSRMEICEIQETTPEYVIRIRKEMKGGNENEVK